MATILGSGMRQLQTTVTADPASINGNTTGTVNLTVGGSVPGMLFLIQVPSTVDAGIMVGSMGVCNTAGTVIARLANVTASPIDVGSTVFTVVAL